MALDNNDIEVILKKATELWIFGYGSILWKTGFRYRSKRVGFVRGFARRFWQGNNSHRGTPEQPGRVATLIPDQSAKVWGCAYQLKGRRMIRRALDHLGVRECLLGGYDILMCSFSAGCSEAVCPCTPQGCTCSPAGRGCLPVLTFMATPDNPQYLGEATTEDLARQVVKCRGANGHNVEYVSRLADYVRRHIPEDDDAHLFDLDRKVRNILRARNMKVEALYSPLEEVDENALNNNEEDEQSPWKLNRKESRRLHGYETFADKENEEHLIHKHLQTIRIQ